MKNSTTFQCLLKLLSRKLVNESIKRYDADYYSKRFKTWEHLIVMVYAQLSQTSSLRELELAFNSQTSIRRTINYKKIHRSTLSDANERRPSECFTWIAQQLMSGLPRKLHRKIKKVVRLMDSSPIQLKGHGHEWSVSHRTLRCQGLKLHVEYDVGSAMPVRIKTSYPNLNDCTMGQQWPITPETIYVFDKGYCDYNWWWKIHEKKAYFVTRLKENASVDVVQERKLRDNQIVKDSLIELRNKNPRGGKKNLYTERLRRVVIKRKGNKRPLVLVTNLFGLPAKIIADLYKSRWDIELFFKWIKQNLKIKKYIGRSENSVKLQLAAALITYLLIAIFKALFKNNLSLHQTIIWIRHNLCEKKAYYLTKGPPIYRVVNGPSFKNLQGDYL